MPTLGMGRGYSYLVKQEISSVPGGKNYAVDKGSLEKRCLALLGIGKAQKGV
jgi:hypothetical protein